MSVEKAEDALQESRKYFVFAVLSGFLTMLTCVFALTIQGLTGFFLGLSASLSACIAYIMYDTSMMWWSTYNYEMDHE